MTKSTEVGLRGDLQKINRNRKIGAKLRPPYPLEESYLPRDKRQEWSCIGLLGQVYIRKECVKSPHWRKIKDVDDVKELWLINTVLPDQAEKAKVASLEARILALENALNLF